MEIARDLYLEKLIQRKHNRLVKVITGIRRCGKSYLLRTLFKNHLIAKGVSEDLIVEMSFDERDNAQYRDPDVFYTWAKDKLKGEGLHYFLLDEVQMLGDFESVLNGLLGKDKADVYVTGSNAKFLSRDIITEFRGRGDEVHIRPLSFAEFMTVYSGDQYQGFEDYIYYGGLPAVVLMQTEEQKIDFLQRLFKETYISDIVGRNKIRKRGELEDLIDVLASNIGTLTNPSKLQNAFSSIKKSKIATPTIKKYLDTLEDSFLIEGAKRYDVKGKAYIETPLKYYFTDLGLRNARINYRQIEKTHSMENVIYNELRIRQFNVDVGVVSFSERNKAGIPLKKQLEVDFVCNKGSKRYYIQSAYSIPDQEKMEQETRSLKRISDSFKKIIITADMTMSRPHYNDDGILLLNVFDFLLNPELMDF
jgi:uncharacterized protein